MKTIKNPSLQQREINDRHAKDDENNDTEPN